MMIPWQPLADRVLATLRRLSGDDLVAVWVHGSAAQGSFVVGRSDLDVLVVVPDHAEADWGQVGHAVAEAATDGGRESIPLELSIIRRSLAESPREPWSFAVHVATHPGQRRDSRVVPDDGHGDIDLLLHLAVARQQGITLLGASPDALVGEIDRDTVVDQLVEELRWAVDEADECYAVLNACRAWRFAETGDLVSKGEGGEWARTRLPDHAAVIERCLARQGGAEPAGRERDNSERGEPATMAGRALVAEVLDELTWG
ncbi:aminoglycoside adenylyltransferase domain-containing protein [Arsenicicoccus dermatophilus]|uniref:aminoglycoside adenylyltransferase domain-containing protein n=1 Tax=Arsenicicoccus dermatophilus TaxID=1076331 RepID=UPI0039171E35